MAEADPRPYKQVTRAQAQQRTRDALIEAALKEFTEGRWEKASLQALSAQAGVTKQTLLRHFGSKDGLLMEALIRGVAEVFEQRWSAPIGDVSGAVDNLIDHYEAWGERSLRVGAWLDSGPPVLAKLSQGARQLHYDWVEYAFAPWLERLDGKARKRCRAALILLCDVHAWWLLSSDLALPRSEVHAILTNAIERLLGERG